MGKISDHFDSAYRDYALDGIPSSGLYEPIKSDLRSLGGTIEESLGDEMAPYLADASASVFEATLQANAAITASAVQSVLSTTPSALPYEVTGISGGIGTGSGGAAGWYVGGVSGGPVGFQWSYQIGSDGKLAATRIDNPGLSTSNTAPTLSLPSGGISGATVPTATVGTIPAGRKYLAPAADGQTMQAWANVGGTNTLLGDPSIYTKVGVDAADALTRSLFSIPIRWIPGNTVRIGDRNGNYVAEFNLNGLSGSVNDSSFTPALASDINWLRGFKQLVKVIPGAQFVFGDRTGNYVTQIGASGVGISENSLNTTLADNNNWLTGLRKLMRYIPGAKFLFGDRSGNYVDGADANGPLATGSSATYSTTTVAGKTQILKAATVISDGTANDDRPVGIAGHVRFTSDRDGATVKPYRMLPSGLSLMQAGATDRVYLLLSYGQSLSIGTSPSVAAAITTASHPGAVMRFNRGVRPIGATQTLPSGQTIPVALTDIDRLVPLSAVLDSAGYGETHLETAAYALFNQAGMRSISVAPGIGGASYEQLCKGTQPYANVLTIVERARDIVAALGWKLEVIVDWVHGNANSADSTSTYQAKVAQLYSDLQTDISAITEQTSMHMFIRQVSSIGQSQVPFGLWRASLANPNIHLTAPDYDLPYCADVTHLTSLGYTYAGDQEARAIKAVFAGATWKPLQPVEASITRSGAVITVPIEGGTGNLQIDTTSIAAIANYGITYTDASGSPPAISSVTVSGSTMTVTLASTPTGGSKKLRAGWYTNSGINQTNICDQDPLVATRDGHALPKRLVHFEVTVP